MKCNVAGGLFAKPSRIGDETYDYTEDQWQKDKGEGGINHS